MRSERAHLQHEVEILNQRVTQESANLKDELKGWFDDRKMAVRMEQRSMESEIQELNYKITVAMSGDSRGEVEGLRWFLTRRAAILIASMASESRPSSLLASLIIGSPHSRHAPLRLVHGSYTGARTEENGKTDQ